MRDNHRLADAVVVFGQRTVSPPASAGLVTLRGGAGAAALAISVRHCRAGRACGDAVNNIVSYAGRERANARPPASPPPIWRRRNATSWGSWSTPTR
jgi:hypothetical protein